jgi:hypothetical protein
LQHPDNSAHQENLRAAAEALVGWMHARRSTWEGEHASRSFVASDLSLAGSLQNLTLPDADADVEIIEDEASDESSRFRMPAVKLPHVQLPTAGTGDGIATLARLPGRAASGLRVSERLSVLAGSARRAAPFAAGLALVGGLAWFGYPYARNLTAWMNATTAENTPTSQAAPVAASAKAPAAAAAARVGQLIVRSDPPGARVLVDGRERGVTPQTFDDVGVGSHTVVLESPNGSVRRTVTVAGDRAAVVSESIFAGWLNVYAPFELEITENKRPIRLDERNRALLAPGPHDLWFVNRSLGFVETRHVEVQPGQTTSLSLVPVPSTLTVTATEPATVFVDGEAVGTTPLTDHPIALGTRIITVKRADGMQQRFMSRVTTQPVKLEVDFSKP